MGINQDNMLAVRAQLCDRIDRIADQVGRIQPGRLVQEIDDIRRTARDFGLQPVADLAHGLESALARSEGAVTVLPYLDVMRDAVALEACDVAASQSFLAMVNQRLRP
jgi:hypothetical protein